MTELAWATLSSPVGPLAVGCSAAGVAQLDFRAPGGAGRRDPGQATAGQTSAGQTSAGQTSAGQASAGQTSSGQASPAQVSSGLLSAARDQLAEYFAGQRQG